MFIYERMDKLCKSVTGGGGSVDVPLFDSENRWFVDLVGVVNMLGWGWYPLFSHIAPHRSPKNVFLVLVENILSLFLPPPFHWEGELHIWSTYVFPVLLNFSEIRKYFTSLVVGGEGLKGCKFLFVDSKISNN